MWFLNQEDANLFIERKLVSAGKIKILPGEGVNTVHFFPGRSTGRCQEKAFQFLMSTRLLKSKGVAGLCGSGPDAVKKKYLDIRFELIGFFEKHHPDSITESELGNGRKKD